MHACACRHPGSLVFCSNKTGLPCAATASAIELNFHLGESCCLSACLDFLNSSKSWLRCQLKLSLQDLRGLLKPRTRLEKAKKQKQSLLPRVPADAEKSLPGTQQESPAKARPGEYDRINNAYSGSFTWSTGSGRSISKLVAVWDHGRCLQLPSCSPTAAELYLRLKLPILACLETNENFRDPVLLMERNLLKRPHPPKAAFLSCLVVLPVSAQGLDRASKMARGIRGNPGQTQIGPMQVCKGCPQDSIKFMRACLTRSVSCC